jgi:phosphomethylpyrimidine synthase
VCRENDCAMNESSTVQIRAPSRSFSAGRGCRTLVMGLVGASHARQIEEQARKIRTLSDLPHGPEIIGDLSLITPDDGLPLWRRVLRETSAAAACLPVYTVARTGEGRIDPSELLDVAIEQMEGGVGLLTIHPTPSREIQELASRRLVPCTSRGGGLVIADAESRGWKEDNAYLQILPQLTAHARRNGTVLSLGASYRSANIFDSGDAAQVAEIGTQAQLAREIGSQGVGVIIESPGHARPKDIKRLGALLRAAGVPIMPLGPIPTDTAIGQDHISSAIGATLLGLEGCAHILAAVTREEHTGGIPSLESTIEAVAAARVAAHVIDLDQLDADELDLAVANARSSRRTCVVGKSSRGCERCAKACPL